MRVVVERERVVPSFVSGTEFAVVTDPVIPVAVRTVVDIPRPSRHRAVRRIIDVVVPGVQDAPNPGHVAGSRFHRLPRGRTLGRYGTLVVRTDRSRRVRQ